ncbi:MAG: GNAT family N-acetyltransferase [Baekduia sp.]
MIRPATVADARTLAELEVRAWRWAYVDIVAEPDMITIEEREARWSAPGAIDGVFVAEVGGRVVGVVQVGPDGDDPSVGRVCGLDVEPAAQGAGVGATLYDHAVVRLRAAGFAETVVWLFEANGHARGFYERRGWTADGATRTTAGAPELRYRQTLAP